MRNYIAVCLMVVMLLPFSILAQDKYYIENNTGIIINQSPNTTVNINTIKRFNKIDSIYFFEAIKQLENTYSVKIVNIMIAQTNYCNVPTFVGDVSDFFNRHNFGIGSTTRHESIPTDGIMYQIEKFDNNLATLTFVIGRYSLDNSYTIK